MSNIWGNFCLKMMKTMTLLSRSYFAITYPHLTMFGNTRNLYYGVNISFEINQTWSDKLCYLSPPLLQDRGRQQVGYGGEF